MDLAGNTVLITGGATGIGYAMAEAFLAAGSQVILCGRHTDRLLDAKTEHPEFYTWVCDITNEESRRNLLDWIKSRFPALNIVVNNAGIQRDIDFRHGIDAFENGENEIRTNLEATVILSGLFIPLLAKHKQAAIINVSSGLGFVPAASMPVYSASKAGVHAFSMALRKQLSSSSIKVFELVPPAVKTGFNPEGWAKRYLLEPPLDANTFVAAVMKKLESDTPEIGYGMTEDFLKASREELNRHFDAMNAT